MDDEDSLESRVLWLEIGVIVLFVFVVLIIIWK